MLRLAGATNEAEATACLTAFRADFNRRFTVPAAEEGACYRAMETGIDLETLFCFNYQRTVGMDNTVRFGGHRLQLLPGPHRRSWARANVEVQRAAGRQPRDLVPRGMSDDDARTPGSAALAGTRRTPWGRKSGGRACARRTALTAAP